MQDYVIRAKIIWHFSFPFGCVSWFSCIITLDRIFSAMLNKRGGSLSLLSMMFPVDFLYINFIMLRRLPSISSSLSVFILECVKFFECFFCINWDDNVVFLFLYFVNVVHYADWCSHIKPFWHSKNKSHLVIMHNYFIML